MVPKICAFPECGRKLEARGLCNGHGQQLRRGASLTPLSRSAITPTQRFWQKVNKTAECWIWTGAKNNHGYGQLWTGDKLDYAHRISYRFANGPIPEGAHLDHVCHNPGCVRPTHLRTVTEKQNGENRRSGNRNNKSGIRGVSWSKEYSRWRAQVGHKGKRIHVGYYGTLTEAEAAVIAKRNELFTHNNHDRIPA